MTILQFGAIPRDRQPIAVGAAFEDIFGEMTDDELRAALSTSTRSRIDQMRDAGFLDEFTYKANQLSTSGCNGGLAANLFTWARWFGGLQDGFIASGAFQYSLMNGGVDRGSVIADGRRTAFEVGFVSVDVCPWSMIFRNQTRQFDALAAKNKSVGPWPARTIQGLLTGLARGHFAGFAIQAGSRIMNAGAGIPGVDSGRGNHAVAAIDLRWDGTQFVLPTYLNWGKEHGHDGFADLTVRHLEQCWDYHEAWIMPVGQWGSA